MNKDSTLTVSQPLELAQGCRPEMRGELASYVPGLSPDQRMALARESTPGWREQVARYAPGLTDEQREELRNL